MSNANQAYQNSFGQQVMIYSETNMKNTVAGLISAISIMQQQQATMEIKQDTISSMLTNVMSLHQDFANKSQNSSQNNCTNSIQNGSKRWADLHRTEQSPHVASRAGGDQVTGSVVQDMASGGNITSVNTAWSENHQRTALEQYRGYDWETRVGQTHRARYEDNY